MTTPATTPEAPKPNGKGAPPPAAVEADDAPLPPLDPDAEVGAQIERAKLNVARAEKKKQKAEAKGKKAPAAAKTNEEPPDTEPAPAPEETDDEPAPDLEAPTAANLAKARALLEKGDAEAAFKLAFGKDAAAFRINSARWAEWRKTNEAAARDMTKREQRIEAATEALEQKYGRWAEAQKAFESEDYEGAFQKAFGLDLNSFQKKALSKFHGKSPGEEALRREIAELRAERQKEREQAEQTAHELQEQQRHRNNVSVIQQQLSVSDDPQIAALGKKPGFIRQVYTEVLHRHDNGRGEPLSALLVAACAEEIRDGLFGEFGDVFVPRDLSASGRPHPGGTNPESPHVAGKKPSRQGAAAAAPTTLSQRGASEASAPTVNDRLRTEEEEIELIRKFTDRMKTAS